jgi:metal-responsive CopG/Arc/MetJ family transcriptional regulator
MFEEKIMSRNRVILYLDDESLAKLDTYRASLGNESRTVVIRAALRSFFQSKELYQRQMQARSE